MFLLVEIDIDVYKKGEMERSKGKYGKDTQRLEVDRKVLTSETVMKNKELKKDSTGFPSVVSGDQMVKKDTNLKKKTIKNYH